MQSEDKDRIEDDVAESADGNGNHAGFGITLCVDKGIESERHLDEESAADVDFHVVPGVENRLITGAEHQEDRAPKAKKQGSQDERNDGQHEGTVAEYLFSGILVAFSHQDRRLRGTAHGGERGKSGNAHDNRHCDADAGQGAGTDVRDMADVHAVNHVIENVDDLCGNCRERQFKKKRPDRRTAEISFTG